MCIFFHLFSISLLILLFFSFALFFQRASFSQCVDGPLLHGALTADRGDAEALGLASDGTHAFGAWACACACAGKGSERQCVRAARQHKQHSSRASEHLEASPSTTHTRRRRCLPALVDARACLVQTSRQLHSRPTPSPLPSTSTSHSTQQTRVTSHSPRSPRPHDLHHNTETCSPGLS